MKKLNNIFGITLLTVVLIVAVSVWAYVRGVGSDDMTGDRSGEYGYGHMMGQGYGPDYGMGPGVMGQGYGPDYGMGPGVMEQGYGPDYGMGPGMMGQGYGPDYGMGPGMMGQGYGMGPGMMEPGYGRQYGQPYGRQYQQSQEPMDQDQAKQEVENYLSSLNNPNLKLGQIEEKGNNYQIDIETQNGSLVDKLLVNRYTGWMRSAY